MTVFTRGSWLLGLLFLGASPGAGLVSRDPESAVGAQVSPCRGPDETSELHVWILQQDAAETDSDLVADWTRAGFLPVTSAEISLVTDIATCTSVLLAYNAATDLKPPDDPPLVSLYVIRVGPRYDAFDPAVRIGEFVVHRIFDTSFVHLNTHVR